MSRKPQPPPIPSNQYESDLPPAYDGKQPGPVFRVESTSEFHSQYDRKAAMEFLTEMKWPPGIIRTLLEGFDVIPYRFMIVDDSGSMATNDGNKLVPQGNSFKMVKCTRWDEIVKTMRFHAELAERARAPTEFRLLNGDAPYIIGQRDHDDGKTFRAFNQRLSNSPGGRTPLCRHINAIVAKIRTMESKLRAARQKVAVIIATDGEASDGDIANALKPLEDLPAWVVIRLCTDEENIIDYWSEVDGILELDMDVLDDLTGEGNEVFTYNKWLTYGEPLHRLREFGVLKKEMDMLDEATLSVDQMRKVVAFILGGDLDDYPDPHADLKAFTAVVETKLKQAPLVWSPHHKAMRPWIRANKLRATYGDSSCSIM